MKKTLLFITILSTLLLSLPLGVYAAPGPKDIEVTLSDIPAAVKAGETVELTAVSVKHGSSYTDNWNNAEELSSKFDPELGCYISKAVFTAGKSGMYTIKYTIQMTAGNSGTTFLKEVEKTIEVVNPVTVIGADIRDLAVKPVYRTDGSISSYSAYGRIYALWSDGTATLNGSTFFFFGNNEFVKDVRLSLNINGTLYTYTVQAAR